MTDTLDGVKVGDILVDRCGTRPKLLRVTRVTKTWVCVDTRGNHELPFRKKDGYQVGDADRWYRMRVEIPRPGEVDEINLQTKTRNLRMELVRRLQTDVGIKYETLQGIDQLIEEDDGK